MRKLLLPLLMVLLLLFAFIARENSTGKALIGTGREYLELLAEGKLDEVHSMLTDSLGKLLAAPALQPLTTAPLGSGLSAGGMEARGFRLSTRLNEGGSRTLWVLQDDYGTWRISGDSSLDNILGSATLVCSDFAMNVVIPAIAEGDSAENFVCPVSGTCYEIIENRLVCPAGHLGEGLEITGDRCRLRREEVARVLKDYLAAGYELPEDPARMYSVSGGLFGQRGGYRCPDNGYAYYEITASGIHCPHHDEYTAVEGFPPEQE